MENQLFDFSVGIWVGGHPPANFSHVSKDAQFTHLLIPILWAPSDVEKSFERKTGQKWILRGLKLLGLM